MNVLKAIRNQKDREYKQNQRQIIEEACDAYIEHMDLLVMMILHKQFGFGAVRLERVYRAIEKEFHNYKRFMADNDRTCFNDEGERDDAWKLKQDLKAIGFDYDKIVGRIMSEDEETQI